MVNYRNSRIYKIVNDVDDYVYIGSTSQSLSRRMSEHRSKATKRPSVKLYQHMNRLGVDHFTIVLIELFPCNTKEELLARENHWQNQYNAVVQGLNMVSSTLNEQRRFEYMKIYNKRYNTTNRNQIKQRSERNKNKHNCDLCDYHSHNKANLDRHNSSSRHQAVQRLFDFIHL